MASDFELSDKDEVRSFFNKLRQSFLDWNYIADDTDAYKAKEKEINELYASKNGKIKDEATELLKDGE